MTHLSPIENLFAVEVPDATVSISFRQSKFVNSTISFYDQFTNKETLIELPGNWVYLFQTKDCSEEQAAGVVEFISPYITGKIYKDYETGYFEFDAATPSLKSLLRANQLHSDSASYLLIKKL